MPNGNVWEVFHKHLRAKGVFSTLFAKVHGHAKSEDIEKGKTTLKDMVGNGVSDIAAGKGILAHTSNIIQYFDKCGIREKLRGLLQIDNNSFLLDMLQCNRDTVAKEKRISNFVGGTAL